MAGAPKAHESLRTEARRVPVQGTVISLISAFAVDLQFYGELSPLLGKTAGPFLVGKINSVIFSQNY